MSTNTNRWVFAHSGVVLFPTCWAERVVLTELRWVVKSLAFFASLYRSQSTKFENFGDVVLMNDSFTENFRHHQNTFLGVRIFSGLLCCELL